MSYSLPLSRAFVVPASSLKKKRKRGAHTGTVAVEAYDDEHTPEENVEYTAVLTPLERIQRRVAGQALDKSPPDRPFPHAPERKRLCGTVPATSVQADHFSPLYAPIFRVEGRSGAGTLRHQHMSNLTSLVHTLIEREDYARAAKALSLLLRTPVAGQTIDIRNGGLWQIGAEILLEQSLKQNNRDGNGLRAAFNRVKIFYDQLARQYPWHRSWPNVTNAQDFKIAMFNLWIWVVVQESRQIQTASLETALSAVPAFDTEGEVDVDDDTQPAKRFLSAKRHELSEATMIAQEMDALMNTIPFMDDPELIRLRGMVSLWTADVIETIDAAAEREEEQDTTSELATDEDLDQTFQSQIFGPPLHQREEQAIHLEETPLLHLHRAESEQNNLDTNIGNVAFRARRERQKAIEIFSKLSG